MANTNTVLQLRTNIAIIDDDSDYSALLARAFNRHSCHLDVISNLDTFKEMLERKYYDVVLLDVYLKGEEGLSIIPYLIEHCPHTKIIVMTAYGSVDLAVQAMKKGACHFVVKSQDPRSIASRVLEFVEQDFSAGVVEEQFDGMGFIGNSGKMREVKNLIHSLKDIQSTVLLTGESGTGKEMVAKALHNLSNRKEAPFIAVNCGAIPNQLLESELFGHKRGAFTDAKENRRGIFEICSEGTVLLDEIGEMPMQLQVKLLRVLQEKEITPVGSTQTMKINTRIIAATNRNLHEEVQQGRFREDLYYRLNVIHVEIPPLRDRPEDIPALVNHFVKEFSLNYGKIISKPSEALITRLQFYDWPGNIRELRNAVERGVVLSRTGDLSFGDMFYRGQKSKNPSNLEQDLESFFGVDLPEFTEARKSFERAYLRKVLALSKGNIATASRLAGRYRADIYRLMNKYGLGRDGQALD